VALAGVGASGRWWPKLLAEEDAITEKAMIGWLAFLLHGNMAVGMSSGAS
jgi:hypothetical protein